MEKKKSDSDNHKNDNDKSTLPVSSVEPYFEKKTFIDPVWAVQSLTHLMFCQFKRFILLLGL